MSIAVTHSKPSPLSAVISGIQVLFDAIGNATPIQVGRAYAEEFGAGNGPRVLIIPEGKGRLEEATEAGAAWSVTHGCVCYVRAPETGNDITRFEEARKLGDKVLCALRALAPARLAGGAYVDASPTNVDAFGADIMFEFTYNRNVWQDDEINSVAAFPLDAPPFPPMIPPGVPATTTDLTLATPVIA